MFPSLYEGFGLPALEAMASGLPVVTSSLTSLPEVVGDAGSLVDPYDIASISAAIRRTVSDEGYRHELSSKGLRRASRFSWEQAADLVTGILKQAERP
jgi:glycosyltransferase involved in cell wall biosynthesis